MVRLSFKKSCIVTLSPDKLRRLLLSSQPIQLKTLSATHKVPIQSLNCYSNACADTIFIPAFITSYMIAPKTKTRGDVGMLRHVTIYKFVGQLEF